MCLASVVFPKQDVHWRLFNVDQSQFVESTQFCIPNAN